jgi:hypothetical protein
MSRSRRISLYVALAAAVLTVLGLNAPVALAATSQPGLPAANVLSYPCLAPFGSVQIPASAWAGSLVNTGHDGATFTVYSNYRAGRRGSPCAGDWMPKKDGTDQWGLQYQCTELAVRVADAEWGIGNDAAWKNAGWNGAADAMKVPGQKLGLTWTDNGTGSLPAPGDLMIWSSSSRGDPGHVGVVSAVGSGKVTFVGENQGAGMVKLPVNGTTVENNGWKHNSSILGWLSHSGTPGGTSGGWNIQATPNPSVGTGNSLQGTSCISPTNCIAVGNYFPSPSSSYPAPLAEHWDGSTWAVQPMPDLPDPAALAGISCTSPTSCTAVGNNHSGGNQWTLAAYWNGSAWSTQTTPNPSGGAGYQLEGVSCTAATNCTAVGQYYDLSTDLQLTLAEHWDGSAWSVQATPNPSGGSDANLAGVSCASPTSCTAVGVYYPHNTGGVQQSLVEHWDGNTWSIQTSPNPPGGSEFFLTGVSCTSATSCTAVGGYYNGNWQPLAEYWDGNAWSIQTFPSESSGWILYGVSCPSATSCTAVGTYGFGDQAQAEYWNGSAWSAQAVVNPSSGGSFPYNRLNAVSCTSATSCTAVGYYTDTAGTDLTLAESI